MKFLFLAFVLLSISMAAQVIKPDTLLQRKQDQPIKIQELYYDSLVSTFAISIQKEVKAHKHLHHTEQVMIVEGEGEMILGDQLLKVRKGDLVVIPKGTVHALKVTSGPVKVISIQSPYFDGTDRVISE